MEQALEAVVRHPIHPLLLLALAPTLLAAEVETPLELPATLQLPWAAPSAFVGPAKELEYFTTFTRPNRRVVMVGAPVARDRLPLPPAECVCDDAHLSCSITTSGARIGWSGSGATWPLASGPLGVCKADGVVFKVEADLDPTAVGPWWHGADELILPVDVTRPTDAKADVATPYHVPEDARPVAAADLSCRFSPDRTRLVVSASRAAAPGAHRCLDWTTGHIDVRLVAAPQP